MKTLTLLLAAAALLTGGRAAAGDSDLTLVGPQGPVVHAQTFTIVLHSDTIRERIRLERDATSRVSGPDGNGDFRFPQTIAHGGTYRYEAFLASGTGDALLEFTLAVEPKLYAMQSPNAGTTLMAPGCSVCVIHDPRGDTKGGPPDLETFSATYAGGWVSLKVVTYDSVHFGDGQHPCVEGWAIGQGRTRSVTMGCFTGPHTGKIYGGCLHPDANGDCGSARMAFPNGHTVTYRFRATQLSSPPQLALQVWILYSGDRLMDTIPNLVHLGNGRDPNCYVIVQLRKGDPGQFEFGKSRCSQAGVLVAKP